MLFGGDITLSHLDLNGAPNIQEKPLAAVLDLLYEEYGGPIHSCYYKDANVFNQFNNVGYKRLEESIIGPGLVYKKGKLPRVVSKSVPHNFVESLSTDRVWWPHDWIKQPFGPNTRVYSDLEVANLLYDMEEYADFTRPFD